jgi:hypothetical protein
MFILVWNRLATRSLPKHYLITMVQGFLRFTPTPSKCFIPSSLNGYLGERNRRWLKYTTFLLYLTYVLQVSSKIYVRAWNPLFFPGRLPSVGQSLMVTNNNAHRLMVSFLSSSHTCTHFSSHNVLRSSTNGLRYTSMSLPS